MVGLEGFVDYNNTADYYTLKNNYVPHRNLLIGLGYEF